MKYLLKDGGYKLRAVTRDTTSASAKALAAQGVEVVKANFAKKDELAKAFEGAWGVFGVTNAWDPTIASDHTAELTLGNNIVDAAAEAKVQVLVYSTLSDIKTATVRVIHLDVPLPSCDSVCALQPRRKGSLLCRTSRTSGCRTSARSRAASRT